MIRPERPDDHEAIDDVVRDAFGDSGSDVVDLLDRIRVSDNYVPELALVAVEESDVIGHVLLSWVGLEDAIRDQLLNLTPMSVRADRQRQGVGTALVREALRLAELVGEPAVMVEGVPEYYPRFGFERASALGFVSPHPRIPDDAFMVKRLPGFDARMAGRVVYPAVFDALGY